MARRGENIRKRKDGRWEGRYIYARDMNGRAIYKSVYGKRYGEVRLKLLDVQNRTEFTKAAEKELVFREVLESWLITNRIRLKASTAYKYRYMLDAHIIPELGNIPMSELTAKCVNEFLDSKYKVGRLDGKGGLSATYVRSMQLLIKGAIRYGVEEGICQPMRISVLASPKAVNELAILSKSEQEVLESYIKNNMNFCNLGILISLNTGLRIGEMCALTWEDVDFECWMIYVRGTVVRIKTEMGNSQFMIDEPKTKTSYRKVPISSRLMPVLKQMYTAAEGKYILSNKERFMNPRTYEYHYHKLLKQCGVTMINYHGLRHTFATRCVEAGVDVKSLSEILGHSNVNITLNTYVHSSMEMKRMQLEKLVVG